MEKKNEENRSLDSAKKIIPESKFERNEKKERLFCIALEEKKIHKYFYKYMDVCGIKRFLKSGKLLYNKPSQFNDSLDCMADIDIHNTTHEQLKEYAKKITKENNCYERWEEAYNIMKNNFDELQGITKDECNDQKERNGILCLAQNYDNLTLWSRYSDDSKGACIMFDVSKDLESFSTPEEVKYSGKSDIINYIIDHKGYYDSIFHKTNEWSDEKEYRILKVSGYGLRFIKKCAVVGIIFGCNIDSEDEKEIKKLVTSKGYSCDFYHAENNSNAYKLDITQEK